MFSPYLPSPLKSTNSPSSSSSSVYGVHMTATPKQHQAEYAKMEEGLGFDSFASVLDASFQPVECPSQQPGHGPRSHDAPISSPPWPPLHSPSFDGNNYTFEPASLPASFPTEMESTPPRPIWETAATPAQQAPAKFAAIVDPVMVHTPVSEYGHPCYYTDGDGDHHPHSSATRPPHGFGGELGSAESPYHRPPYQQAEAPFYGSYLPADAVLGQNRGYGGNNTTDMVSPPATAQDDAQADRRIGSISHTQNKPDTPYAKILYQALMAQPDHKMTLREIYQWFSRHTNKDKNGTTGWQNSIRHNLSMNHAFVRVETEEPGAGRAKKSAYWKLADSAIRDGVMSTTRYRAKVSSSSSSRLHGHSRYAASSTKAANGRKGGAAAGRAKRQQQLEQQKHLELQQMEQHMQLDAVRMNMHHQQHQHAPLQEQQMQMQLQLPTHYPHPGYAFTQPTEPVYATHAQVATHHHRPLFHHAHANYHHPHQPHYPPDAAYLQTPQVSSLATTPIGSGDVYSIGDEDVYHIKPDVSAANVRNPLTPPAEQLAQQPSFTGPMVIYEEKYLPDTNSDEEEDAEGEVDDGEGVYPGETAQSPGQLQLQFLVSPKMEFASTPQSL